jgi:hypothetical protein
VPKFLKERAKLIAAFDASGKAESEVVVVAGFIASQNDWSDFSARWVERLKQDELEYFHMVDFAASRRQFANGGETMSNAANKKEYSLNAYVLAARTCAADARRWQEREGFQPATAYIFEDGDKGKGPMMERFLKDCLPEPVFRGKREYTPLQAADILAYELHKPHRDMLVGKPPVERFRFVLKEMVHVPGIPGYYSPANLDELNRKFDTLSHSRNSGEKPSSDVAKLERP